jgi:hypothetical protein
MGNKVIFTIPFLNKAAEAVKAIPKSVWVAAIILPGGLIALGTYVIVKGAKK